MVLVDGVLVGFGTFGRCLGKGRIGELSRIIHQLNDVAIIEEASAHLKGRNREQSATVSDEAELEKRMSSLSLGKEEAQAEILLTLAEFSRFMVVLESTEAKDATKAVMALPARLQAISNALPSLESQYQETLIKVSRSIRALQHRIENVACEAKRWDLGRASSEWIDASNEWLRVLIPFITDILAREATVSNSDWRDCLPH